MGASNRPVRMPRFVSALAALWLCCTCPAWAGGGGQDAGTLQTLLNEVCGFLQGQLGGPACPPQYQYPTALGSPITELVLEIAALENAPPEMVRYLNNISPVAAINAVNPPAGVPFVSSRLMPLAFISPLTNLGKALVVTQPGNDDANSFFYAGTDGVLNTAPTTLYLSYDYPARTIPFFVKGQDIADIALPLVVVNSDFSQRAVPTVLRVRGTSTPCSGGPPCYKTTAVGDFKGMGSGNTQSIPASDIGLNLKLSFAASPNSKVPHAIFELPVSLVMVSETDPEYFASTPNPASPFLGAAWNGSADELGFTGFPANELSKGAIGIGIAPGAALGPTNGPPFTANIANNFNIFGGSPPSAVGAFLAIATDGETLVSAPVPQ